MFGVCLGYVGHYQGQSRRSQFRRLGRHSSNPGLPVNNSSELSKIIKNQLSIRISSCIVFCWFLLSWLMSHGGETLKQNCGYSCYVVQAVHTSIHLTRHWHCFELTGNSEVHHARDARLIKIDQDWSRLWSWYSTVCFASAVFSLALSGRETSTTPQKSWKARGLEGCPEIKSFPGRTHRNWFLLHIFWWIGMYFIYTRIRLVSSFSFSVSLLFPPAFAEDRFLSSWCHSHKWFQMCSYPFASKQISLVLELIEELLLCHKVAHMLLLPTFLVRPGSAQLRSIRPSIHQTRSQKESWQTLWKISKNKTHFRCTQSQATFLSFSLFGTIWDD